MKGVITLDKLLGLQQEINEKAKNVKIEKITLSSLARRQPSFYIPPSLKAEIIYLRKKYVKEANAALAEGMVKLANKLKGWIANLDDSCPAKKKLLCGLNSIELEAFKKPRYAKPPKQFAYLLFSPNALMLSSVAGLYVFYKIECEEGKDPNKAENVEHTLEKLVNSLEFPTNVALVTMTCTYPISAEITMKTIEGKSRRITPADCFDIGKFAVAAVVHSTGANKELVQTQLDYAAKEVALTTILKEKGVAQELPQSNYFLVNAYNLAEDLEKLWKVEKSSLPLSLRETIEGEYADQQGYYLYKYWGKDAKRLVNNIPINEYNPTVINAILLAGKILRNEN